jgi:hypothetical protein
MRDGIHIPYLHECMPIVCITGPTQMFKPNTHLYSVAMYMTFYYEHISGFNMLSLFYSST